MVSQLRPLGLVALLMAGQSHAAEPVRSVEIVMQAPTSPFPHVWERMMGSGRAALTMRVAWRRDLRDVKAATGLQYVRFHAIFHDELGVYDEDKDGAPKYNFQYVDQIYDGLLANGVRPFVELSFMPKKLAARLDYHVFWYRPIVSPPKDAGKWAGLVTAFARHLVERYGIDEVSKWYFEVWNEPNLDFWTGQPTLGTYFDLYDRTARALKAVDARLRVGGPATAKAAWVPQMIDHVVEHDVPLDFVSTHVYGDDPVEETLGPGVKAARFDVACPAMRRVRDQVRRSARPDLPVFVTETNVSSYYPDPILRGRGVGTWLAETVAQCDGVVDMMALWAISDVFEEQGVMPHAFAGGFGVMAQSNIPRPAFVALHLLHQLGEQRLPVGADDVIATRRADGALVIAAWNRVHTSETAAEKTIDLKFVGRSPPRAVRMQRLDAEHGDTWALYQQMGGPTYPSRALIARLRAAAMEAKHDEMPVHDGVLRVRLPPDAMILVEVPPGAGSTTR